MPASAAVGFVAGHKWSGWCEEVRKSQNL